MTNFIDKQVQVSVEDLLDTLNAGQEDNVKTSTGIASRPAKGSDNDEGVISFFRDMFANSQAKAAEAREAIQPEMYRLAKESAYEVSEARKLEGITQSLTEGGGEIGRKPLPEGTTLRPVARPSMTTLRDVTGTDEGKLDNEQPLRDLAGAVVNEQIPSKELEPTAKDETDEVVNSLVAQLTTARLSAGKDTEEAAPVTAEAETTGLMSRPLTSDERTALSNKGSEITIAQGYDINNERGIFSQDKLNEAVSSTIRNPTKKALMAGMVEVEVGDRGPVVETGYSRGNVAAMSPSGAWGSRLVRDGIMTPSGQVTDLYSADNVFNSVYANRLGNGDFASGDGSRYKGRGLLQLTGRTTYQEVQNRLQEQGIDIDIMSRPELVLDNRYALPAALAYLDYKGLDDSTAESMTAKGLNNLINGKAPRATAERRWNAVVDSLRASGDTEKADAMALRNEYAAQEAVGTTTDGDIGRNSRRAMRNWLEQNEVTIPEDASDIDLVILVNRNS